MRCLPEAGWCGLRLLRKVRYLTGEAKDSSYQVRGALAQLRDVEVNQVQAQSFFTTATSTQQLSPSISVSSQRYSTCYPLCGFRVRRGGIPSVRCFTFDQHLEVYRGVGEASFGAPLGPDLPHLGQPAICFYKHVGRPSTPRSMACFTPVIPVLWVG